MGDDDDDNDGKDKKLKGRVCIKWKEINLLPIKIKIMFRLNIRLVLIGGRFILIGAGNITMLYFYDVVI